MYMPIRKGSQKIGVNLASSFAGFSVLFLSAVCHFPGCSVGVRICVCVCVCVV